MRKQMIVWMSLLIMCFGCFSVQVQAKVTVEIWPIWANSTTLVQDALKPFIAQNPDIDVNVTVVPRPQQQNKLITAIAAGAAPDIVLMLTPLTGMALQGLLTPMDSMMASSKIIRAQDYPPQILNLFKVNGKQYGIPGIEVGPNNGLIVNADLMETAGMPAVAPATLEDLFSVGKKLTKMQDGQIQQLGFYPMTGMAAGYFPESWPFLWDLSLYDPIKHRMNINTPEMVAMLEFINSYHNTVPYDAIQTFTAKNGGASWQNLVNGKVAMNWEGYWAAGNLITSGAADRYRFMYGWVPNIRKDKMQFLNGWGMVIPITAEHPKEAFKVIEALVAPESSKLIYERNGWINGNLRSMSQLDLRSNPGIQWYIKTLTDADRIRISENNPIYADVRRLLTAQVTAVFSGKKSPQQALEEAQTSTQALLDAWKYW